PRRPRPRLHVRGVAARGREPLEGGRPRDVRPDGPVLPGDDGPRSRDRGGASGGPEGDPGRQALAATLLLGGFGPSGRMVTQGERRKRWVLNERAFDGLLARLGPDRTRAAEEYERLRRKLYYFFARR